MFFGVAVHEIVNPYPVTEVRLQCRVNKKFKNL